MIHKIHFCLRMDSGLVELGSREVASAWEKHPALEASGGTYKKALEEIRIECKARKGHIFGCFLSPDQIHIY